MRRIFPVLGVTTVIVVLALCVLTSLDHFVLGMEWGSAFDKEFPRMFWFGIGYFAAAFYWNWRM